MKNLFTTETSTEKMGLALMFSVLHYLQAMLGVNNIERTAFRDNAGRSFFLGRQDHSAEQPLANLTALFYSEILTLTA